MDTSHQGAIAPFLAYQLCRTRTGDGDVDLVLNLFLDQETVSVTTIARLPAEDVIKVVSSCVAHLEGLGAHPIEDAIACARAP